MKDVMKYAAVMIVCGTLIWLVSRVGCCGDNESTASVYTPADTNFTPVVERSYRPPSLPLSKRTSGTKLPRGLKEKDVRRVVTLTIQDVEKNSPKRIEIVETHAGEVYVHHDPSVESVEVTSFEPPVVSFALRFGVGLSAGRVDNRATFAPVAFCAPIEWYGWLHAPIATAELAGVGVGAQARIYHELFIGAVKLWRYDEGMQAKITLSYTI
jgi:hypothetical protein